ncbi:MAG: hypothetical protein ACI4V7_04655 [Succinivibrionaceae bacterium]
MIVYLKEINSRVLFQEYLCAFGIEMPKIQGNWEFSLSGRIMAKIVVSDNGTCKYYIASSQTNNKNPYEHYIQKF